MTGSKSLNLYSEMKIVLDQDHRSFDSRKLNDFLGDLAHLLGCKIEDFRDVEFHRGCVLIELKLPDELAKKLIEIWEDRAAANKDDLEELVSMMKHHSLVKVSNQHLRKIEVITTAKSVNRQLVFVHGWRGDQNSFGRLPEFLIERFKCQKYIHQYPTKLAGHSPSIVYLARNLDYQIRRDLKKDRFALIAHSMGGVVARKFLILQQSRKDPLFTHLKQVTLIASPYTGASLAKVAKLIPFVGSSDQINELAPGSTFLDDLNEQWQFWLHNKEGQEMHVRHVYGTADTVVPPSEAQGIDSEAVPILGAGHRDIVKPPSPNSEIVKTIAHFIEEAGL